jgi:4-hydroxy-3-polyprenylbenzoate decarboxylase
MAYADLRSFLRDLDSHGELRHVRAPVDPYLEVTEIVGRVVKDQGPALVFDNPVGSSYPIVINVFGTMRRMAMALGVESLDEIGDRIGELIKPELPQGFGGIKDALGKVASLRGVPPKKVRTAPCQEVVKRGAEVDLYEWPALTTGRRTAGRS